MSLPPPPGSASDRKVREALLREGFTPEEVEDALRDEAASRGHGPAGAPGYPPPGSAHPPGAAGPVPGTAGPGYPPPAPASPAGMLSWGLGLLAYLPVPAFSLVIAGAAMALAYPAQRRRSPVAAQNARNAANWGLTLVAAVVVIALAVVVLVLTGGERPGSGPLLPFLLIIPLGIAHLVVVVRGMIGAHQGRAVRAPAVPFFRG